MAKRKDFSYLIGQRRHCLTAVAIKREIGRRGSVVVFAIAKCDCGKTVQIPTDRFGKNRSCGCQTPTLITKSKITHGHTRRGQRWPPEYGVWAGMIRRCENRKVRCFPYYGGRGIKVCARWRHSFETFYADMGPRPSNRHSIDRIDNDGNYEPENCRWTTGKIQARGRARYLEVDGLQRAASEWAEDAGIATNTLLARVRKGRDAAEAVAAPLNRRRLGYARPKQRKYPDTRPCAICRKDFTPPRGHRGRNKTCSRVCQYKLTWETRRENKS